ncbi:hypothetical protein KKH43_01150 [Patescibacteria group bacterium]|nr:hypothetical protein [Patescibacteria group bacterium]
MKITICGSIAFQDEMNKLKEELEKQGHEVKIPPNTMKDEQGNPLSVQDYYTIRKSADASEEWVWDKKEEAMMRHFEKVDWCDAILVLNKEKNGILGYVGANTLMEMGLALYLDKPIYLLHPVPTMSYTEEILGMKPIVLDGDIRKLA